MKDVRKRPESGGTLSKIADAFMKAFKIIFYALIPIFFIIGRLTGIREFFMLFIIMLLMFISAAGLNLWTVLSFSYMQELSVSKLVKGDQFKINLGIYNDKFFPFTMMRVHIELVRDNEKQILSLDLSPNSSINFEIPASCPYRGEFKVGMTRVEANDIFGIFRLNFDMRWLPYYRMPEVMIYPKVTEIAYLPSRAADSKAISGERLKQGEDGDSFSGLRSYRPGDTARFIHWKQSIKKGELFVKQFETPAESNTVIAMDTGCGAYTGETALFYADMVCECAAAIARHNLNMARTVRVIDTNGFKVWEGSSGAAFNEIYEYIARLPFEGTENTAARVTLEAGTNKAMRVLYVITSEITGELGKALANVSHIGCATVCLFVCDDPEKPMDAALMPGTRCVRVCFGDDLAKILGDVV